MARTPLSEEDILTALSAYHEHGTENAAAAALGIHRSALHRRLERAAELGRMMDHPPSMPGYHIKQIATQADHDGIITKTWVKQTKAAGEEFEHPPGHIIKGVSALVGPDNRVTQQWIKTRLDVEPDWVDVFQSAFKNFEGRAKPIKAPELSDPDFLNLIPCNDWHINMLCWAREVGESWDLKIAERVIGQAIENVIKRARPAGVAVVLGGGDLMHNDDNTNRTAKSSNVLDADGRHAKGIEVAQRLKVRTIDAALATHDKVLVRILKGNHDEQSAVAIAHFLSAWYRNEPRVTVDLDQSLYWHYRFGKVMLSATHGHAAKLKEMPSIMAHRRPEDWGATKYRYAHGFHVHHKETVATEGGGVICESHQAPIPKDSWHFGEGYISGRSIQIITYHKNMGEFGRVIEAIPDK